MKPPIPIDGGPLGRRCPRCGHPGVGTLRLRAIRPDRAYRRKLEDMGDRVRRGPPRSAAPGRRGHGDRTGADARPDRPERPGSSRRRYLLGCRCAHLSVDRPDQPAPARRPADTVLTPHLHVYDDGDVRRHRRCLGLQVLPTIGRAERSGSDAGGGPPTPRSPSYPSEHAATAGAAAAVLSYFFPDEAAAFQAMAEEAAESRVLAGLQYPSDSAAGLELGRKVAEQVLAAATADRLRRGLERDDPDRAVHVGRRQAGQHDAAGLEADPAHRSG